MRATSAGRSTRRQAFDFLDDGECLTLTYTVRATDDSAVSDDQTVTITINGTNDAPVISVGAGDSDAEARAETNAGLAASGTLTVVDADLSDAVTATVDSVVASDTTGVGSDNGRCWRCCRCRRARSTRIAVRRATWTGRSARRPGVRLPRRPGEPDAHLHGARDRRQRGLGRADGDGDDQRHERRGAGEWRARERRGGGRHHAAGERHADLHRRRPDRRSRGERGARVERLRHADGQLQRGENQRHDRHGQRWRGELDLRHRSGGGAAAGRGPGGDRGAGSRSTTRTATRSRRT